MKRIFFLTLILSILLLSACSAKMEIVDVSSNTETEIPKTEEVVVSSTSQATESATKNTEKVTESSLPTTVEQEEITTQVEPNNTSVTVTTEPVTEENLIIKASASDCSVIADKIIEYINAFRVQEDVGSVIKLSGLIKYAEYRSRHYL